MPAELHERARLLTDQASLAAISPDEQRWLTDHLAGCTECEQYAELSRRTVAALNAFAFEVDSSAALQVRQAIVRRTSELAARERAYSIAISIAILLTIGGTTAMWAPLAWIAKTWAIAEGIWQPAFLLLWLVPSILLVLFLVFRGPLLPNGTNEEGDTI